MLSSLLTESFRFLASPRHWRAVKQILAASHNEKTQNEFNFLSVFSFFLIMVSASVSSAAVRCEDIFEDRLFPELEFMQLSPKHQKAQEQIIAHLVASEKQNDLSKGLLPSFRQGQNRGRLQIGDDQEIVFGSTPQTINGKRWIAAKIKSSSAENEDVIFNYQWLSMESLYRFYGNQFFTTHFDMNEYYLAPTDGLNQKKFEVVKVVKIEGEQFLIQNAEGKRSRIGRADFFDANLIMVLDEHFGSLRLSAIRDFFAEGGRGDIFLHDSSTGRDERFEGFYIHIKKFPQYSGALFYNQAAYAEIKKAFESGVRLFYGAPNSVGGVAVSRGGWFKKISNRHAPLIIITEVTSAAIFSHEKTHYDDYQSKEMMDFYNYTHELKNLKFPKSNIDFQVAATFVFEQRAYAVEHRANLAAIESSDLKPETYEQTFRITHSMFKVNYAETLRAELVKLKAFDEKLYQDFVIKIKSLMFNSNEFELMLP